jgi:hypothetical protein
MTTGTPGGVSGGDDALVLTTMLESELHCPYCGSYTEDACGDVQDNPSETFDKHFIGITCSDCNEYYEIVYEPSHYLFWENGDPKSTEHTTPPRNREEVE